MRLMQIPAWLLLALPAGIPAQASVVARNNLAIELDLDKIRYSKLGQDLWRSSIFWNPRNPAGSRLFVENCPDPRAARVFGLWWWQARRAKDLASFEAALETRRRGTEWLLEKEDKLVVHIAWMPPWLSRSEDKRKLNNESYEVRNAVGPKTMEEWKEAVQVFARFIKSCRKGKSCELYYEFWNEPDLMYWQGGLEEFLTLYAQTVAALLEVDPDIKVGGCASNGWRNKLSRKRLGNKPITQLLIDYCGKNKVPLDFVSWHWFDYRPKEVEDAARTIRAWASRAGLGKKPELLITEWNAPRVIRDSRYQPFVMADFLLTSRRAGIEIQCQAAWQDFHPEPRSEHYGLITHDGRKRTALDVHLAFDAMSRCKEGTYVLRRRGEDENEGQLRLVLGKEGKGRYRLLIWRSGQQPGTVAAMRYLRKHGIPASTFQGILPHEIEGMIGEGTPDREADRAAWKEARKVQARGMGGGLDLFFAGAKTIRIRSAKGLLSEPRDLATRIVGNRLSLDLRRYELASLEIEIR